MKHFKTRMQFILLAWFFATTVLAILLVAAIQALALALSAISGLCDKIASLLKNSIEPIIDCKEKIAPQPCDIAEL